MNSFSSLDFPCTFFFALGSLFFKIEMDHWRDYAIQHIVAFASGINLSASYYFRSFLLSNVVSCPMVTATIFFHQHLLIICMWNFMGLQIKFVVVR